MKDRLNILFLHSQDDFGADSAIHADLMRYLDRDRFSVHVASSKGDGTSKPRALAEFEKIPNLRVRPTQFAPGLRHRSRDARMRQLRAAVDFPVDFAMLGRYVASEKIHLIHGSDRPRDAVSTLALAKLTGAKSVVHVHVGWSVFCSAPSRWGVRRADGVFAISRWVAGTVFASGTPRERVHTVPNAIDPAKWDPNTDGLAVRREFGVPAAAPLLVSVSRLFGQKGQRELLQALAAVRRKGVDARLLVVGGDSIEVHGGSFTAELKVLAAELGVADRVVFTGPRSDIPAIMAAADVFTLPSFEEPFGLVFLEAMAMQRPVVALDDGGTPEVVEHEKSGLLSRFGDIETMADNIVRLIRDPKLRAQMGAYGRSRVLAHFNVQRMARDAAKAYESIVT
ncbi:MAG TPA: glycosyltransferase family 4 protein [Polyangiaceae bacterium]|jgi:glycosyltransferase involved in cell wall biosynthesis|nr:glycosyltransferase family 4 protein [Polyangiaceae bacterium]